MEMANYNWYETRRLCWIYNGNLFSSYSFVKAFLVAETRERVLILGIFLQNNSSLRVKLFRIYAQTTSTKNIVILS